MYFAHRYSEMSRSLRDGSPNHGWNDLLQSFVQKFASKHGVFEQEDTGRSPQSPVSLFHENRHLALWLAEIFLISLSFTFFIEPFRRTYEEHLYAYEIIWLVHAGVVTTSYALDFRCMSRGHAKT